MALPRYVQVNRRGHPAAGQGKPSGAFLAIRLTEIALSLTDVEGRGLDELAATGFGLSERLFCVEGRVDRSLSLA
jgi:hypothetical protein